MLTAASAPTNEVVCWLSGAKIPNARTMDANIGNCHAYAMSEAPLLTPRRYGSANGFRRTA